MKKAAPTAATTPTHAKTAAVVSRVALAVSLLSIAFVESEPWLIAVIVANVAAIVLTLLSILRRWRTERA